MTRSELIDRLACRFPDITDNDAKHSVAVILDAMTATLARGDRIELRGFGAFTVNHRSARIGRNPMSGETVQVPAKAVANFKTGKELRERVDL